MEEIRGVTWDLWGEELSHEQTIQRIVKAGFPVHDGTALTMFAIVEGESGEYQRAWHANVQRDEFGDKILRFDEEGKPTLGATVGDSFMKIKSIDLGFMQFNVPVDPDALIAMTAEAMDAFVESKFDQHPELADPWQAADRAFALFKQRGFQPWYAYKPGTLPFWKKKRYGAMAFARWHLRSFVGQTDRETGKKLDFEWKS